MPSTRPRLPPATIEAVPSSPWDPDAPEVLARADGVLGEVVLRRRGAGPGVVHELVVNGTFLMDTVDVSTERLLAQTALDAVDGAALRVLVGGLGLGFTAAALLADPRVVRVTVVEIEPLLVRWLCDGVVPSPPGLWDDPRLTVVLRDITDVVAGLPSAGLDALVLDVDNGPDFLVHDSNARVYEAPLLKLAAAAVRPGGVVAVWSAERSPALHDVLAAAGACDERLVTVTRGDRDLEYAIYLAVKA